MNVTVEEARRIAGHMVELLVRDLDTKPPADLPATAGRRRRNQWHGQWRKWYRGRVRDVRFASDPAASAPWFEILGLDWDVMTAALRSRGLLDVPPLDMVPEGALATMQEAA